METPTKKVAIFGLPGSGKSTFASKLGNILRLPVYHLDKYYFQSNWKIRDRSAFLADQEWMVEQNEWIIEGNSIATLETRYSSADLVIYFQFSRLFCLWRVFKRIFFYDRNLKDAPDGCSKSINWSLLKYLWTYEEDKKDKIATLKEKYPHIPLLIFHSTRQVNAYLKEIENNTQK